MVGYLAIFQIAIRYVVWWGFLIVFIETLTFEIISMIVTTIPISIYKDLDANIMDG